MLSQSSSDLESSVGSGNNTGVGVGIPTSARSSVSYYRLHDSDLRLSVLKLDGTSFEVTIAMTATVSDLKTAVEDVFKDHVQEDGGRISWTHVWGHFCLCYEGHKLVDDREYLKDIGIKDEDQLYFIRHLSLNSYPIKKQLKNQEENADLNVLRLTGPKEVSELEQDIDIHEIDKNSPSSYRDNQCRDSHGDDTQEDGEVAMVLPAEFKLARTFRRWLSSPILGYRRKSERTLKPGKLF